MEDLFSMEDFFLQCDEDFCPPPMFDLPPPPPPPWLEVPAGCRDVGGCGDMPTVHSIDQNVEEIFHSISIIVVSALVIVISVIFAALLVYRRRQLVRKFGSSSPLPSAAAGELKEKEEQTAGTARTTRPNHYISDHQLVMDAQGRSVLTSTLPANPTLLIGGMPFHLLQKSEGGTPTYNYASNGSYSYASYPPTHLQHSVYPVYETIGSDYSELSSVYSDRLDSSHGSGVKLVQSHMVSNMVDPRYISPNGRPLVLHGSSNTISGSGRVITPEMALLQRLQEQQQQARQVGVHGQQQQERPVMRSPLRNLPVQRSKSLKIVQGGQRGPLPSLPASPATSASTLSSTPPPPSTSSSSTPPPPRILGVESTISLEHPPSASSPITQL